MTASFAQLLFAHKFGHYPTLRNAVTRARLSVALMTKSFLISLLAIFAVQAEQPSALDVFEICWEAAPGSQTCQTSGTIAPSDGQFELRWSPEPDLGGFDFVEIEIENLLPIAGNAPPMTAVRHRTDSDRQPFSHYSRSKRAFKARACRLGEEEIECGPFSQSLVADVPAEAATAIEPIPDPDGSSRGVLGVQGGPSEFPPGVYQSGITKYNGWYLQWANNLGQEYAHPEFGTFSDLHLLWVTYMDFNGSGSTSDRNIQPVWLWAGLNRAVHYPGTGSGVTYYGGALMMSRVENGQRIDTAVGEVQFRLNGQYVAPSVAWFIEDRRFYNPTYTHDDLAAGQPRWVWDNLQWSPTYLNLPEDAQSGLSAQHHWQGWWRPSDSTAAADEFELLVFSSGTWENASLAFFDGTGKPVWATANRLVSYPTLAATSLCVYAVTDTWWPDTPHPGHPYRLHWLTNPGYTEVHSLSTVDVCATGLRNWNYTRTFGPHLPLGTAPQLGNLDVHLKVPAMGRESASARDFDYQSGITKWKSNHAIRYIANGQEDPDTCYAVSHPAGGFRCKLQASWYTDGRYPHATLVLERHMGGALWVRSQPIGWPNGTSGPYFAFNQPLDLWSSDNPLVETRYRLRLERPKSNLEFTGPVVIARTKEFIVKRAQSPQAWIESPSVAEIPDLAAQQSLEVVADAVTPNGQIAQVEFFAQRAGEPAQSFGVATTEPFTATWTPTLAGQFDVFVVATDGVPLTAQSSSISIDVLAGTGALAVSGNPCSLPADGLPQECLVTAYVSQVDGTPVNCLWKEPTLAHNPELVACSTQEAWNQSVTAHATARRLELRAHEVTPDGAPSGYFDDSFRLAFVDIMGRVLPPRFDAAFKLQEVSSSMPAGGTQQVAIEFWNSGTDLWKAGDDFTLQPGSLAAHVDWGVQSVPLPHDVPPCGDIPLDECQAVRFTFQIQAPTSWPDSYAPFEWRMHVEGVGFGSHSALTWIHFTEEGPPPPPPEPVVASDKVGATFGEFRVDESGAATYSIPIFTTPGAAGVAPQLAFQYSSQGGDGPLGRGFSIAGQSAISRCRATREHGDFIVNGTPEDGDVSPIDFSDNDEFCLDGARLLDAPTSTGCPLAPGGLSVSELRTEIESFQRVCMYSDLLGPRYFTVQRKDGSTSWYGDRRAPSGALADGYLEANGVDQQGRLYLWAQTRFHDSVGNHVDYGYFQEPGGAARPGELLLREISYTGKIDLTTWDSQFETFASVHFVYGQPPELSTPGTLPRKGYVSGSETWQTRMLDAVEVREGPSLVRSYEIQYEPIDWNAPVARVASIRECAPEQGASGQMICLPPTEFEWSPAGHAFPSQWPETAGQIRLGSLSKFEGFRFADVDGDGRPDLVWVKDGNSGDSCTTDQVHVLFSRLDSAGAPYFTLELGPNGASYFCAPREFTPQEESTPDRSWFLFDYDGDGRDDLFVIAPGAGFGQPGRWRAHRSRGYNVNQSIGGNGEGAFDRSLDLLQGIDIPAGNNPDEYPQLTDLNGDGLTDIVYWKNNAIVARLLDRGGPHGFQWGHERTLEVFTQGASPCNAITGSCSYSLKGLQGKRTQQQLVDFNGDARTDLLVRVELTVDQSVCDGMGGGDDLPWLPVDPNQHPGGGGGITSGKTCKIEVVVPVVVDAIGENSIAAEVYGTHLLTLLPSYPHARFDFADVNGDGLTDIFVFYPPNEGGSSVRINTGSGFQPQIFLGFMSPQAQLLDINGDGLPDLVYPDPDVTRKRFRYRPAKLSQSVTQGIDDGPFQSQSFELPGNESNEGHTTGSGTGCDHGNVGFAQPECLAKHVYLFLDLDGDGVLEYLRILLDDGDVNVDLARSIAAERARPRSHVLAITNGLGARTDIDYVPLTNRAVYRRDYGTRNAAPTGRGSPVQDLIAATYVVARARSSAPTFLNPASRAEVYYRYVGAQMQAGGRGHLGFREVQSIDTTHDGGSLPGNGRHHVVTRTLYHQDFPFVGRPQTTERYVIPGDFVLDECLVHAIGNGSGAPVAGAMRDECFVRAPDLPGPFDGASWLPSNAVLIASSAHAWESEPPFDPGEQQPLQVRTAGTVELSYAWPDGELLSTVETTFSYAAWGNVFLTAIETQGVDGFRSLVSTVNQYTDDPQRWHLGRLTSSTVTHARGPSGNETVVERSSTFAYVSSGPARGMLARETVFDLGTMAPHLNTWYEYDDRGNRTASYTCSAHYSEPQCKAGMTADEFAPADPERVKRRSRQTFPADQRYPHQRREVFSGPVELTTATVDARDLLGNVTRASEINGVVSETRYGAFGRPFYSWTSTVPGALVGDPETGVESFARHAWCDGAAPVGEPSVTVPCPLGAVYRVKSQSNAGPTSWSYRDALDREMLAVAESPTPELFGQQLVGSCTAFDRRARAARVSEPFFVAVDDDEPVVVYACIDVNLIWSTSEYDPLGRVVLTTRAGASGQTVTETVQFEVVAEGLETRHTDALGKTSYTVSNALGEVVESRDHTGFSTRFTFDPTGNLTTATRNAGAGDIDTVQLYDSLGRRTYLNDPDAGERWYAYNAAGEMIRERQGDDLPTAAGVELRHDARGRVVEKRVLGAGGAVESLHTYGYDTPGAMGQMADERVEDGDLSPPLALGLDLVRIYRYDGLGRPEEVETLIDGGIHNANQPFVQRTVYDDFGRVFKTQDASGHWLKNEYGPTGALRAQCESSATDDSPTCPEGSLTYLRTLEYSARGQVVKERRGGLEALDVERAYNHWTGRLEGVCSGGACDIQSDEYRWDEAGNLSFRDIGDQYREEFQYDDLHRLIGAVVTHVYSQQPGPLAVPYLSLSHSYDALGNICQRVMGSIFLDYQYAGASGCSSQGSGGSPHAVARISSAIWGIRDYAYDDFGNQTVTSGPGYQRTLQYTVEQQVRRIDNGQGDFSRFWYGPDGSRYKHEKNGSTTLYLGNVEMIQDGLGARFRRYVAGVAVQSIPIPGGSAETHYLFHDHLGSVVRVVTSLGAILEGMDYGPFGERRGYVDPTAPWMPSGMDHTDRGFTGHQMLDNFDVVHMNGRIYDMLLARFLQPDPFVQEPANGQNWNRYTYVWNNPLNATDPSGYLGAKERQWLAVIYTAVTIWFGNVHGIYATTASGAVAGQTIAYVAVNGAIAGGISSQSWQGAAWGAFSSMVSFGIGQHYPIGDSFDLEGVATRAISGGVLATMQGGRFGHGFASAGVAAAFAPYVPAGKLSGTMVSALIGGTASRLAGGKFANGAVTAAMQFAVASGGGGGGAEDGGTSQLEVCTVTGCTRNEGSLPPPADNGPLFKFWWNEDSSAGLGNTMMDRAANAVLSGLPHSSTGEWTGYFTWRGPGYVASDPVLITAQPIGRCYQATFYIPQDAVAVYHAHMRFGRDVRGYFKMNRALDGPGPKDHWTLYGRVSRPNYYRGANGGISVIERSPYSFALYSRRGI